MLSKISRYLKEVRSELLKVRWPSKQETVKMTMIVVSVSAGVGLLISVLDLVFTRLLGVII